MAANGWLMEMNSSTHKAHAYGLSKACNFMSLFSVNLHFLFLEMSSWSHKAQRYGLSPNMTFYLSLYIVPGDETFATEHIIMNSPQGDTSCVSSCGG